jgi:hypothetical protein
LKALPPTAAELAGWTSCGSVFPFSQSCLSTAFCCLSVFCSSPGPALGLLRNLEKSPVNNVDHVARCVILSLLSSMARWLWTSSRQGQRRYTTVGLFKPHSFTECVLGTSNVLCTCGIQTDFPSGPHEA